jgi:hypothetical protein
MAMEIVTTATNPLNIPAAAVTQPITAGMRLLDGRQDVIACPFPGSGVAVSQSTLSAPNELLSAIIQEEPSNTSATIEVAVDKLKEHDLLRPQDVDKLCSRQNRNGGLVEGLIAGRSVSVLIGDSGLGKSPLAYQLGLCVAAGMPFLGLKTNRGTVVYADYENGLEESRALRNRLIKFLNLPQAPDNFMLWTPDCGNSLNIESICRDVKPALFIVDSLRSHDPAFEKSDNAGHGMSKLRSVAYKHGVAMLVVHHVKKPGPDGVPPLDSDSTVLMYWLNQASGHRSIINQSDSRIAADLPTRAEDAAMVLRWHRRLNGEGGPVYVERVHDGQGEPIGYRRMTSIELLSNKEQEDAYHRLPRAPANFTFKDAKTAYGRSDNPTRKWLVKCQSLGLVEQVERGLYCRAGEQTPMTSTTPRLLPPQPGLLARQTVALGLGYRLRQ